VSRASRVAALLAMLVPGVAHADSLPERVWGVGGGLAIGSEYTSVDSKHTFWQPLNLEVRAALSSRLELGVHVPVSSMIYANRLDSDVNAFVWFDTFVTWYPLRESGGLFVAPGLGMLYGSTDDTRGFAIEIPLRIGWETSTRSFGRALAIRPWFDVVIPSGNIETGARWGAVVELTLIGYATRTRPAAAVVARE
jgi:hypothetical protein